jgi:acetate kinase
MRVLVLNCGSSSLKFRVVDIRDEMSNVMLGGMVDRIGGLARLRLDHDSMLDLELQQDIRDHDTAVRWALEQVELSRLDAVGHRVVHGGDRFSEPARIDEAVLSEIERLSDLAPLHNPTCLAGISAARAALGHDMPMVAVFDTAFHRTIPERAATYAIPRDLTEKYGIRRYGFHGIAHASLVHGYAAQTGRSVDTVRAITLHLGNGCSAAAIQGGRSVDTSMGFTPLEGLVMGTRSGDIDPAIVSYLARRERISVEHVEQWLNERSGLLGMSGLSHDVRDLLAAERQGDARAGFALEVFCYRIQKYIGAYLAVLGGADAVIFGGGIGEHSSAIRARICDGMEWCGLVLDRDLNDKAVAMPAGSAARISQDGAKVGAYVVAADEETWIARETVTCLRKDHPDLTIPQ